VAELSRWRREDRIDKMSLEPRREHVTRLMTLHGAKGLEAPVVCLADPTGRERPPRNYVVDREATPPSGHFRVCKRIGDYNVEEIARPRGWREMQEIEKRFDDAERVRFLYVAATRAKDLLGVSIRKSSAGRASGPWEALDPFLKHRLPERAVESEPPRALAADSETLRAEIARAEKSRIDRRAHAATPSFEAVSVTALSHSGADRPDRERTGKGMTWGRVLHRLLEALMQDPAVDVRTLAANLLADEQRRPEDIEEVLSVVSAVQASPLWRRALAANRRLVEIPFALRVPAGEPATGGEGE